MRREHKSTVSKVRGTLEGLSRMRENIGLINGKIDEYQRLVEGARDRFVNAEQAHRRGNIDGEELERAHAELRNVHGTCQDWIENLAGMKRGAWHMSPAQLRKTLNK